MESTSQSECGIQTMPECAMVHILLSLTRIRYRIVMQIGPVPSPPQALTDYLAGALAVNQLKERDYEFLYDEGMPLSAQSSVYCP